MLFETHTLLDRSIRVLKLGINLCKLIANGQQRNPWWYPLGFTLIRVDWALHCLLFEDIQFAWFEALTNNPINLCLISMRIISYYF